MGALRLVRREGAAPTAAAFAVVLPGVTYAAARLFGEIGNVPFWVWIAGIVGVVALVARSLGVAATRGEAAFPRRTSRRYA